jgi:hypothetical protein
MQYWVQLWLSHDNLSSHFNYFLFSHFFYSLLLLSHIHLNGLILGLRGCVEVLLGCVSLTIVTILTNKEPVVRDSNSSHTTHTIHSFFVFVVLITTTGCTFYSSMHMSPQASLFFCHNEVLTYSIALPFPLHYFNCSSTYLSILPQAHPKGWWFQGWHSTWSSGRETRKWDRRPP